MSEKNKKIKSKKDTKISLRIPTVYDIYKYFEEKADTLFEKIYLPKTKVEDINLNSFLDKVDAGELNRRICLGVSESTQGLISRELRTNPGCVTIGGQGSGKTTTMKSITLGHFMANCDNTLYVLIDALKGASDFSNMFHLNNVVTALNDMRKVAAVISMLFTEYERRKVAFVKIGSFEHWKAVRYNSLLDKKDPDYEKKIIVPPQETEASDFEVYEQMYAENFHRLKEILMSDKITEDESLFLEWMYKEDPLYLGAEFCSSVKKFAQNPTKNHDVKLPEKPQKITMIYILFEEFHKICPDPNINFLENYNITGTVANQLKDIAKTGRSFGFSLFISSQRATYTEIPRPLMDGISNALVHRVKSAADAAVFGDIKGVEDIKSDQIGRSAHETGHVQSLFYPNSVQEELIRRYTKPLGSILFGFQPDEYKKILSMDGSDGMVDICDYSYLILNSKLFDTKKIARRYLNLFEFELIDDNFSKGTEISAIYKRGNKKYALYIASQKGRGMSYGADKTFESFKKEVEEIVNVDGVIILSFDSISTDQINFAKQNDGFALDKDDLLKHGRVMDSREELEEKGIFEGLYNQLALAVKPDESKTEEAAISVSDEVKRTKKREDILNSEKQFMEDFSNLKPSSSNNKEKKTSAFSNKDIDDILSSLDEDE